MLSVPYKNTTHRQVSKVYFTFSKKEIQTKEIQFAKEKDYQREILESSLHISVSQRSRLRKPHHFGIQRVKRQEGNRVTEKYHRPLLTMRGRKVSVKYYCFSILYELSH